MALVCHIIIIIIIIIIISFILNRERLFLSHIYRNRLFRSLKMTFKHDLARTSDQRSE